MCSCLYIWLFATGVFVFWFWPVVCAAANTFDYSRLGFCALILGLMSAQLEVGLLHSDSGLSCVQLLIHLTLRDVFFVFWFWPFTCAAANTFDYSRLGFCALILGLTHAQLEVGLLHSDSGLLRVQLLIHLTLRDWGFTFWFWIFAMEPWVWILTLSRITFQNL